MKSVKFSICAISTICLSTIFLVTLSENASAAVPNPNLSLFRVYRDDNFKGSNANDFGYSTTIGNMDQNELDLFLIMM